MESHNTWFLWLASFTCHDVFKIHLRCGTYQHFIPFHGWNIFHSMYVLISYILFTCPSVHEYLGCFHCAALMNNAAMNIHEQVLRWACVFILSGIWLGAELLGQIITLCLTFWGNKTLFSKALHHLQSHHHVSVFQLFHRLVTEYIF